LAVIERTVPVAIATGWIAVGGFMPVITMACGAPAVPGSHDPRMLPIIGWNRPA